MEEEQRPDRRWIILAVFALVAVGVVAAILIGRGGGDDEDSSTSASPRPAPAAARKSKRRSRRRQLRSAGADPEEGRRSDRCGRDQLRHLRDRARHQAGAEDRQLLRLPRRRRLLRRPHLPPGRPRLRDPGRRPARHRHRRPRLQRRREAAARTSPTPKAWWRWRRARPSRPAAPAASSTSSPRADAGLPPEYALVGKVSEGYRRRRTDRQARARQPKNRNRRS